MRIWSVGHSTHSFEAFLSLLGAHRIGMVADVRAVPKSRRHPQFGTDALARELPLHGIGYAHLVSLGGWRRPHADSPNGGWRNESFRGYADHTSSEQFAMGMAELHKLAAAQRTAMMCSEALWWRCHRRLIADQIVAAGGTVCHIGADGRASKHELTSFAVVDAGRITYPPR